MKFPSTTVVTLFATNVIAFPTLQHLEKLAGEQLDARTQEELRARVAATVPNVQGRAAFNAAENLIDVSGVHAFVAPGPGDVRGPCPGLNVLANHGYLPHNGVATISQYTKAVKDVFNMGTELGGALSVFGTAVAGNLVSLNPGFSMGGITPASSNLLGNLLGLLGKPKGLTGTHGQYEEDSSATRGDLYLDGDNNDLIMSQFLDLYNLQKDAVDPNYSMDVILQHNVQRYYNSLNKNPYFWYGPIGGTVVRNAAYAFAGRLFANYSEEHPTDGRLSKETLKSFHGVTGPEDAFVYKRGEERIPENFYRRPTPYGVLEYSLDLQNWAAQYPFLLNCGGNTGSVNSFVGLDISDLSGGVLNAQDLLRGNNAVCLGLSLLIEFSPSLLTSLYTTITTPLKKITDSITPLIGSLDCPQLKTATNGGTNILEKWKTTYPGVKRAGVAF